MQQIKDCHPSNINNIIIRFCTYFVICYIFYFRKKASQLEFHILLNFSSKHVGIFFIFISKFTFTSRTLYAFLMFIILFFSNNNIFRLVVLITRLTIILIILLIKVLSQNSAISKQITISHKTCMGKS